MLRVAVSVILLLSPAFAHGAAGGLTLAQLEAAVCTGPQLTRWSYDETGALLSTTDALGGVWTYLYDLNRNLVSKQDANLQLTTYAFDSLDRRTRERQHLDAHARVATRAAVPTDAAAADLALQTGTLTWSRTYDSASNVLTTTDAKGQVQTNVWGILNRLTSTDYTHVGTRALPSLDGIDYGFDENGNLTDATERKTTSTGATVETTLRTFDALDRLKTELRYDGKLVQYDYDLKGNRTQVLDSSSVATDYTFDALDRLKTATLGGQTTSYGYWPDSLPKSAAFGNGINEARCYDAAGRLTTLVTANTAITAACVVATPLSRYDYGFDLNGNRTSQLEQRTNPATQALGLPENTTYGFDDDDRLVGVRYPDTGALYRLDAVGNRTGERRALASNITALTVAAFAALSPANLTHDISSTFTRADWLSTQTDAKDTSRNVALAYDLNGNTTQKTTAANTRTFSWDCRDTLVSVADNGVALGRYDYDRNLQRVKRTAGAENVEYVLDDKYVLQEADGSQSSHPATRRYHYAAQPLAVSDGPLTKYLSVDALGSVTDATSTSGSVTTARQYNAWGEFRNNTAPTPTEPKLGYTGHQVDPETGLNYMRRRYQDPVLGIFLSRDPLEGEFSDAPSLHRYAYVKNNPLRYVDPTGEAGLSCPGKDPASVVACSGEDAQLVEQRMAARKALEEFNKKKAEELAAKRAEREAAEEMAKGPSRLKKVLIAVGLASGVGPTVLGPGPELSYLETLRQDCAYTHDCALYNRELARQPSDLAQKLPGSDKEKRVYEDPEGGVLPLVEPSREKNPIVDRRSGESIADPVGERGNERMEAAPRYHRNKTERKKALLRDAEDPSSGLTPGQRAFIKKKQGENVPPGTEVSHDPPLYTVPPEQRAKLDKAKNMKTVPKEEHKEGHREGGEQYEKYGPPSDYPWNVPDK